jgi:zona occludens toxin
MILETPGRPFYVDGIPDLAVDHEPAPPVSEWTTRVEDASSQDGKKLVFTFPQNSIILIDECQRIYRPRASAAAVPDHVAAFETHRHGGLDFWLLTQHAGLIDSNLRKLIGRHIHLRDGLMGRYLYEWSELGAPEQRTSRELAATRRFKLPKKVFNLYTSASLHVKNKRRVPWYVFVFGFAGVSFLVVAFLLYRSVSSKLHPQKSVPAVSASAPGRDGAGQSKPIDSPLSYVANFQARIPGLAHTAPAYDGVTVPKVVPFPSAVMMMRGECRAYTDQATRLDMSQELCKSILNGGLYRPWLDPQRPLSVPAAAAVVPAAPVLGSGGS